MFYVWNGEVFLENEQVEKLNPLEERQLTAPTCSPFQTMSLLEDVVAYDDVPLALTKDDLKRFLVYVKFRVTPKFEYCDHYSITTKFGLIFRVVPFNGQRYYILKTD